MLFVFRRVHAQLHGIGTGTGIHKRFEGDRQYDELPLNCLLVKFRAIERLCEPE